MYTIETDDGIIIEDIPDNIPRDSDILKQRVAKERAIRTQQQPAPQVEAQPAAQPAPQAAIPQAEREKYLARAASVQKEIDNLKGPNEGMSMLDSLSTGAGRGINTFMQGLGVGGEKEGPLVKRSLDELEEESTAAMIGNIAGEAAPFVVGSMVIPGLGATRAGQAVSGLFPKMAINSFAKRLGFGALAGGAEENILSRGRGGNQTVDTAIGTGTGAIAEAFIPVLGKYAKKIYKSIGRRPQGPLLNATGSPTQEFKQALEDAGTTFDQLTADTVAEIKKLELGVDVNEVARKARFESQDIPYTKGDISQSKTQQAAEQKLLAAAGSDEGFDMSQIKLQQSNDFIKAVNKNIDELGVPDNTGIALKEALSGKKKLMNKEKTKLYKEVFDAAPEIKEIPIIPDNIKAALPDPDSLDDMSITFGDAIGEVKTALARYGVDTTDEAGALLKSKGLEVKPLNIGNYDRLRKLLGNIARKDPNANVVTKPLIAAIDAETEMLERTIRESASSEVLQKVNESNVFGKLKEARKIVRETKTEFDPKSIVGKMIDNKKNSLIPVIEESKVVSEMLRPGAPVENVQRVVNGLKNSGKKGKEALGNLQASVYLGALERSLKAPSRKSGGIEMVGGNQFAKYIKDIGEDKLKLIFGNNPKGFEALTALQQTAKDMTPENLAVPKGSAGVILDIVQKFSRVPGGAPLYDALKYIGTAGKDRKALKAALDTRPGVKKVLTEFEKRYPAIFTAMAVPSVQNIGENNE